MDCPEKYSKPDIDDPEKLSSVSSLDLYEEPPNVDTLEDALDQPSASFTAAQIGTIRETVQLSVAEVLSTRLPFPELSQPFQGLGTVRSSSPVCRPSTVNPIPIAFNSHLK